KVGGVSDETLGKVSTIARNLEGTTKDLVDRTIEYGNEARKSASDTYKAYTETAAASERVGGAMAQAAKDAVALATGAALAGAETEKAAGNTEWLATTQQGLAQQIAETVKAIEAASAA